MDQFQSQNTEMAPSTAKLESNCLPRSTREVAEKHRGQCITLLVDDIWSKTEAPWQQDSMVLDVVRHHGKYFSTEASASRARPEETNSE